MYATRNDLPVQVRETTAEILNDRLSDAIDLGLQVKHAHWNVKGPNFIALHELFDDIAENVEEHVDTLAERITALGATAQGTVAAVSRRTSLAPYPNSAIDGMAHVEALADSLADFGKKVRKAIDSTAELGDADTSDVFTEVSRDIDKYLWFLEAHLHDKG
jgi:starvation-inducible DNA-binding protein